MSNIFQNNHVNSYSLFSLCLYRLLLLVLLHGPIKCVYEMISSLRLASSHSCHATFKSLAVPVEREYRIVVSVVRLASLYA